MKYYIGECVKKIEILDHVNFLFLTHVQGYTFKHRENTFHEAVPLASIACMISSHVYSRRGGSMDFASSALWIDCVDKMLH